MYEWQQTPTALLEAVFMFAYKVQIPVVITLKNCSSKLDSTRVTTSKVPANEAKKSPRVTCVAFEGQACNHWPCRSTLGNKYTIVHRFDARKYLTVVVDFRAALSSTFLLVIHGALQGMAFYVP